MRVKTYRVLEECVERGINRGWMKAHKHTDTPSEFGIKDWILDCVMQEVDDYFTFTNEDLGVTE